MGAATTTSAIGATPSGATVSNDATHAVALAGAEGKATGIVGHRAWLVQSWPSAPGRYILRSITSFRVWEPGMAMRDVTHSGHRMSETNDAGVYAWKTAELCDREELPMSYAYVWGTVTMWGTVIEHEHGYRSEYAAILSLDRASSGVDLEALRKAYLPALS